jgi:hypothetical protein
MNKITRYAILAALLLLAVTCYVLGVPAGGGIFLLLGLVFEGLFWFGVFKKQTR